MATPLAAQTNGIFPAADWPKADEKVGGRFVLADMDADGKLDALTAHPSSDLVGVMLGDGLGGFEPFKDFPVGVSSADDVGAADLDSDGYLESITAHTTAKRISVLIGLGEGDLGKLKGFPQTFSPVRLALGDLDLDGEIDVLVADTTSSNLHWLAGDGGGDLETADSVPIGGQVSALRIADVDDDGQPDVLATLTAADSLSVVLVTGNGDFHAPKFSATAGPNMLDSGDVDGDGNIDVVVETGSSAQVTLLLGDGTGSFPTGTPVSLLDDVLNVRLGDCDGDDQLDLLAATKPGVTSTSSPHVTFARGAGNGSFFEPVVCLAGGEPGPTMRAGDLNGDGRDDLVTVPMGTPTLRVFLASPAGAPLGPQATPQVLSGTWSLVSGDFDGDPWPDVVIGRLGSYGLSVMRSDAAGVLSFASSVASSFPSSVKRLASGDFDADGLDDIASVDTGDIFVATSQCLGADSFGPPLVTTLPLELRDVAAGDLDGDGDADLVLASILANGFFVLESDGAGGWQLPILPEVLADVLPVALALGDLNDDGDLDVVGAGGLLVLGKLGRLLGDGAGGLSLPQLLSVGTNALQDVALGDVNGDGFLDAATLASNQPLLLVSLNDHAGGFQSATSQPTAAGPVKVRLGDVDGDGRDDALVSCLDGNSLSLFRGSSTGVLPRQDYGSGSNPSQLALADLAVDGMLDVLVVDTQSDQLGVLRNQRVPGGAWADIGGALPGAAGVASLSGVGLFAPGGFGAIKLVNAAPSALALICLSIGSLPAPFKGGMLKAFPPILLLPIFTDAAGELQLPYFAPVETPSALHLVLQVAIVDAGAPKGVALSTALQVITP